MAVNNFKQIRELLEFKNNDTFYFISILQRKKDAKEGEKVNGTNNNSRLIKAYYVHSLEYFDFIEKEVIELCEVFNARAGINLNRRSYEKMALQHLKKVTDQILSKDFHKAHKAYNSVAGAYNHESDKKWIIDLDGEEETSDDFINELITFINSIQPHIGDTKLIEMLPTKNGVHLITSPFNMEKFKEKFPSVEIHKNNPTALFYN